MLMHHNCTLADFYALKCTLRHLKSSKFSGVILHTLREGQSALAPIPSSAVHGRQLFIRASAFLFVHANNKNFWWLRIDCLLCHYMCVSRLPKDQDCHELWSRMMKKALRERMARPVDDHSSAADTRNSSSTSTKIASTATVSHSVTTASSHKCSSAYPKNTVAGSSSHSTPELNLPVLLGQHRSRTGHSISSQHNAAGDHDKSAECPLSSSSIHTSDSSYFTHRPPVTSDTSYLSHRPPVTSDTSYLSHRPPVTSDTSYLSHQPPVTSDTSYASYWPPVTSDNSYFTHRPLVTSDTSYVSYRLPVTSESNYFTHHSAVATDTSYASHWPRVTCDTSYLSHQPAVTRHFDLRHISTSSSDTDAPMTNNHWCQLLLLWYWIMINCNLWP